MVQTAGLAFQRSTVDRDVRVVGKVRNRIITADLRGALDCISSVIFAERHASVTAGQFLRYGDTAERQPCISTDAASLTDRKRAVPHGHFRVIHQRVATSARSVTRHHPSTGQSLATKIQRDNLVNNDWFSD